MLKRPLLVLGLSLATAACSSLQAGHRDVLNAGADVSDSDAILATTSYPKPLWQRMEDPILEELIAKALAENPDLSILASRVKEARLTARAELAGLGPTLSLGTSATAQRISENGTLPVTRIPGLERDQTVFDAGFDASWELDLFGRGSAMRGASEASVSVANLELEDARLSLISEIARTYVEYRSSEAQTAILDEIIERQARLVEAVRKRRDAGEASDIDLLHSQTQLAEFEARRPALNAASRTQLASLAILTGRLPGELQMGASSGSTVLNTPDMLPQAVGSDTFRNRPDVRRAEQAYTLAARREDIAAIDLYPSVTLIASAGPNATDFSDVLDPASLAANLAGLVSWTLFDSGKRKALQSAASERTVQAELAYRRAVLAAAGDVELALAHVAQANSDFALASSLASQKKTLVDMAEARLAGGTGTVLEVLNAEQDAGEQQLKVVALKATFVSSALSLEKAIGRY
jgi:NodT family efflux transporter outer membrane factor (OMF) lipoprotein